MRSAESSMESGDCKESLAGAGRSSGEHNVASSALGLGRRGNRERLPHQQGRRRQHSSRRSSSTPQQKRLPGAPALTRA